MSRHRRPPSFVRAVRQRRRAAARPLQRLALVLTSFVLSAVTVVPWVIPAGEALGPVVLEGVQSGAATLTPGSSSVVVPISPVDPTKAFLVFGLEEDLGRAGDGAVSGRLADGSTLVFERTETGGTAVIRWQVAEFGSGVRVQRGTLSLAEPAMTAPLSAVEPSRSFVLSSMRVAGDHWADGGFLRARLTSPTTLELAVTAVDLVPTVEWQVIEYAGASVQHGVASLSEGATSATAAVAAVDVSRAWLITSYKVTASSSPPVGELLVRGRVASPTTVVFDRSLASGSVDVAFSLVAFEDRTGVVHGSEAFAPGEAQRDVSVPTVDPARALAVAGYQTSGGRSPYSAVDLPGVAFFTLQLVDGSSLRLRRGATVDAAEVGWFVVYWPLNHPPVFDQDLGDRTDPENTVVSLAAPATDPDGDVLAYSATGLPPGLSLDSATGLISGTIASGAEAGSPYGVEVRAEDPDGLFATDTFTWMVAGTNHSPVVADPGDRQDPPGAVVTLPVSGSDPNGDPLTWSATGLPPGLSIDPATGVISGTITGVPATYQVEVAATDDGVPPLSGTVQFAWTVSTDLTIAKVSDVAGYARPGQAITYTITVTNPGPGPHTGVVVTDPLPPGTRWISTEVTRPVDGPPETVGDTFDSKTYSANSGTLAWQGPWVEFNDDGTPSKGGIVIHEHDGRIILELQESNRSISRSADLSGYDRAMLRYEWKRRDLKTADEWVTIEVSGDGGASWTQVATYRGPGNDAVYTAEAGIDLTAFATAGFSIRARTSPALPGNHELRLDNLFVELSTRLLQTGAGNPPPALNAPVDLMPGESLVIRLVVEVDDPLAASISEIVNTATVTSDQQMVAADATVRDPAIRAPIFDQDLGDRTDPEGTVVSLPSPASDPDGDVVTWSATGLPPGLGIDPTTGLISGTISYDASPGSPYPVVIRAEDPEGLFVIDTFSWTVTNTNRAPAFEDLLATRADGEGSAVLLPVPATDPDGDSLTWSAAGLPPGLVIDPATGAIWGTIGSGAAAGSPYAVSVRVEDPAGLFDAGTFTWTVGAAELRVTKSSDAVGRVVPGQVLTYTIGITNVGAVTHSGVVVEDPIPAGTSYLPGSARVEGGLVTLYGDGFDAPRYDGSAGPANWSPSPWQELGESDGPLAGDMAVVADAPFAPYAFRKGGSAGLSLARVADLSGHTAVTLLVEYRRQNVPLDAALWVEASATGLGGPWTVLGSLLSGGTDATYRGFSANLSAFAGAGTALRLRHVGSGLGPSRYYFVDDVRLAVPAEGPADVPPRLVSDVTLAPGQAMTVTFSVRVDDSLLVGQITNTVAVSSERQVVPVTATVTDPTNRPPDLESPGHRSSAEGDGVVLPVPASDPDGDALAWTATGLPPGLGIDGATGVISGTITYEAAPGSPYSVTVRVEDIGGLFDTTTFTWAVADTNRPPTFDGDLTDRSDAEGVAVSLPTPATDLDGNTLAWSAVGLPPGLSIDPGTGLISGTITFDASPGSPYPVMVRVEDRDGLFDTDGFMWTVTDTNRAPVLEAGLGNRSNAEGDAVWLPTPAADPDGDPLMWSAVGLPLGLAIDPASGLISGTVSYDAAPGSPYLVVVRVQDPGGLRDSEAFSWAVTDTNRAPVVGDPGSQGSGEGQVVALGLLGIDPDGDGLIWSALGLPPGLAIDPISGAISGAAAYDASPGSPYMVTVRATDDGVPSLGAEVSFSWVVSDTNRAPVVDDPGDRADAEGRAVAFSVAGFDPDGDVFTWSATGLPPGVAIDPATGLVSGTITYEASPGSPYGVTVTATDDGVPVLSSGISFLWTVADTNRPPEVLHPGDRWAAEGDGVSLAPVASDPDGDVLSWAAAGLPPGLSIDRATGVISGVLSYEAAAASPHTVTLTVDDGGIPTLEDATTFIFTVADTNRPPVVTDPGPQQAAEGDPVLLFVAGLDPDGDSLTWAATGLPPGLSIDPAVGLISGKISYEAAPGSPHAVQVTVTDDGVPVLSAGAAFLWTVADTNRAPQILPPGNQVSAEGDAVRLPLTGWDPDGDGITWSAVGLPPGLSIDPATGDITGITTYEAAGSYPVTVVATDDGSPSRSSQAVFAWQVAATNRPPEVTPPGDRSDAEGRAVSLTVGGSDPDGDGLTWSAVGLPPGLAIAEATGVISGVLGFSSAGVHMVTVTVADDGSPSLAAGASFSWAVADTNRAPVVIVPADRTDREGTAVALPVSGSDPDGDGLTWSAAGLPPGLAINPATGIISGTLGFGAAAGSPYRVMVAAADDGVPSLAAGGTFSWSIGDMDRAPAIDSLPDRSGEVGEGVGVTLTGSDPDGDTLTWSASGLPPGVSLAASTGRLSGTLSAAGAFTVTITVRAGGKSAVGSFTWLVAAAGAPVLEPIGNQSGREGDAVALSVVAEHPGGEPLAFTATGLPPGISLNRATGALTGTLTRAGVFGVTVRATDPAGAAASITFLWMVEALVDLPPEAQDDVVVVARDTLGEDGVVVVEVLGNDRDPEGDNLTLMAVSEPEVGEVTLVDGAVVFWPPAGWFGTVVLTYRVADPSGQQDEATVTITVREGLDVLLAASSLQWRPPDGAGVAVPSLGSSGTVLGALVSSLHVLRMPLALLGGAIVWSLVLGGALNLGLALRRGLPAVLARRSRLMAIVMAPQGAKVAARRRPGGEEVVWQFLATDARIKATSRHARVDGGDWSEVVTDEGAAWVEAVHLTEHIDRAFFAEDRAPWQVLERFVDALRRRQPLGDLVSRHGLWVAHHDAPVHYPADRVAGLWSDPEVRVWKGRNPAYPDLRGTFDTAVAAGVLDAYDHPGMELVPDRPAVPSTVIPVEFANLHFISIGADLLGPERLDQTAWLVFFAYEAGKPRVIGLGREG